MSETPTIHVAMSRVMADVQAIGKEQRNEHFDFNFRGIDDVMNALHGPLTKHGVFYVPVVKSSEIEFGGKQFKAVLKVCCRFYGPAGDWLDAGPVVAEGLDTQDKASTKALQLGVKYVLLQTFCIPTEEQREADPDRAAPTDWGKPERATGGGGGGGPTPTGPAAEGTAPSCPKCGSGVWDNSGDPNRGNRPVFKCRDKSCDWATWKEDHFAAPVTDWSEPEPVGGGS